MESEQPNGTVYMKSAPFSGYREPVPGVGEAVGLCVFSGYPVRSRFTWGVTVTLPTPMVTIRV